MFSTQTYISPLHNCTKTDQMQQSGPKWTDVDRIWPKWTEYNQSRQNGPRWIKYDGIDPNRTKADRIEPKSQNGPIYNQMDRIGRNETKVDKIDQIQPNWTEVGQIEVGVSNNISFWRESEVVYKRQTGEEKSRLILSWGREVWKLNGSGDRREVLWH